MESVQTQVEKPTFETVWAALQETDRLMKANAEQQRQEAAERRKEFEREAAERQKETDRQIKRLSRQMGDLHNKFGKIAEHLVAPGITKRFNELGYHFGEVAPGGTRIFDENGKIKTEIDLLLENGETIMAVEVKVTPALKDVEHHIKRLEILRDHRRGIGDRRKVLGAIAGAMFGIEEKKATADAGLYVIEQSGDTMKIDLPDDFVPRVW